MANKSIFEQIRDREIPAQFVYEDEECMAFHDLSPQAPVHVLLVPKRRIDRLGEAQREDAPLLGHLLSVVPTIAESLGIKESGFRLVINHGEDGGETVPHLHLHLLGGRPLEWPLG